jgi:hypothetical protein
MSELSIDNPPPGTESRSARQWLVIGGAALVLVVGSFLIGHYFGYRSGYQAAYVPEHSHFIFEQKRATAFQRRITDQRRCIDQHVSAIPSIDASGFAALGELFRNFGLLYLSTRLCDSASGFGIPTQAQLKRIIPSANN